MLLSVNEYADQFEKSLELSDKLRERVFLKTELDIVYTDLSNWERGDILFIADDVEKGQWKKLNYLEYIWLKVLENLRKLNFSYDDIRVIKDNLFVDVSFPEIMEIFKQNREHMEEKMGVEAKKLFDPETEKEVNKMKGKLWLVELLLLNAILRKEKTSLLFFPGEPELFIPFSHELVLNYERKDMMQEIGKLLSVTHVSISLSEILSKFLMEGDDAFENIRTSIITKEEQQILKLIRKKSDTLKKISIIFKDKTPVIIEVETIKKAQIESRIMDHISKGDYSTIEIKTEDGKLAYFKNTKKIKL